MVRPPARLLVTLLALVLGGTPLTALAQSAPPDLPSYSSSGPGSDAGDQPPGPPPPPQQGPPPAPDRVLTGVIGISLDSKSAYAGEPVTLNNVSSFDGAVSGAAMDGTVTDVTPPGQGRNAQIRMHFDSLRFPDGTATRIDGVVVSVDVKTKSNAAKEAGGALVGMLAGNALGKVLLGASGFGLIGAVGGFLIAKDNRADVVIPANTGVTVRLVPSRRQASED
jgi:hypothetical protein